MLTFRQVPQTVFIPFFKMRTNSQNRILMNHNTVPYLPCCLRHGMMARVTVPHFSHPLGITPRSTAALCSQIQTHFVSSQCSEVNSEPALPQEAPQIPASSPTGEVDPSPFLVSVTQERRTGGHYEYHPSHHSLHPSYHQVLPFGSLQGF